MKMLSLWQPWATLIATGIKTIETRPWKTEYRGPLAILASKKKVDYDFGSLMWEAGIAEAMHKAAGFGWYESFPRGCVVAVVDLVDVVPISERWGAAHEYGRSLQPRSAEMFGGDRDGLFVCSSDGARGTVDGYAEDQLPWGDFSEGRYGWLLENVRPIEMEPIPCRGTQGCRDLPADVQALVEERLSE